MRPNKKTGNPVRSKHYRKRYDKKFTVNRAFVNNHADRKQQTQSSARHADSGKRVRTAEQLIYSRGQGKSDAYYHRIKKRAEGFQPRDVIDKINHHRSRYKQKSDGRADNGQRNKQLCRRRKLLPQFIFILDNCVVSEYYKDNDIRYDNRYPMLDWNICLLFYIRRNSGFMRFICETGEPAKDRKQYDFDMRNRRVCKE